MNIIEAIFKAKANDKLLVAGHSYGGFTISQPNLARQLHLLISILLDYGYEHLISSDDWQIERKPLVWEGEVIWGCSQSESITNNVIRKIFGNKRTKIRIEEIVEKD